MNTSFIETTRNIYDHFVDEKSKQIYANRLRYNLTGDENYIRDIVKSMPHIEILSSWLQKHSKSSMFIYGAGKWGEEVLNLFPDYQWSAFIDKAKLGEKANLPIIKLDQLKKENASIVVSLKNGYENVITELVEYGINIENIFSVGKTRNEFLHEYFGSIIFSM